MGISKQRAAQNREAIIAAAERLFRDRGVDGVGLNELMDAAGFTRGGFYNHFKSKGALVAAVLDKTMQDGAATLAKSFSDAKAHRKDPLKARIEEYLSAAQRNDIEQGCPLSGFVGDVRRLDASSREIYAHGLEAYLKHLTTLFAESGTDPAQARAKAIAAFSQMVGGLLLSRAVQEIDPKLADEVLTLTRRDLLTPREVVGHATTGLRTKASWPLNR